jgi:hypothetical protein
LSAAPAAGANASAAARTTAANVTCLMESPLPLRMIGIPAR